MLQIAASSALIAFTLLPHMALKRSEPAADARLTSPPPRIALWFTGKPQVAFSHILLHGPAGDVRLDSIVADTGNGILARISYALPPGAYQVAWHTAGADGHPLRGEFAFSLAAAARSTAPAMADSVAPVDSRPVSWQLPAARSELAPVRWLEFVALLAVLGALGFRHAVLPPLAVRGVPTKDAAERARRIGRRAAALYVAAALVRLWTESVAMSVDDALQLAIVRQLLGATAWGFGWIAGFAGAVVLAIGWSLPRRVAGLIGLPLALTGAFGMLAAPALSGHAVASRYFIPSVTLDMLHVAAAGLWIGGVVMVLLVGVPAMRALPEGNRDAALKALVSSFHPLALFCAPLVVLAGVAMSAIRLGSIAALRTPYGTTLLWKVGLFALVIGMGGYNALRARKRLGTPEGTRHFVRTGSAELIFAALVLAATTILVMSPVPSEIGP